MGLYIDMEMPKEGSWVTLRVFPDGQCVLYSWCGNDFDFMEHLTAVPVPEPHGRLGDLDALREVVKKHATPSDAWVFSLIRTAPTVIPAAEEGE